MASGYQRDQNKAGPLNGLDFTKTFDCSSSSAEIKGVVNMVANINVGCCKGNNGAPKSVCWTPPRKYILSFFEHSYVMFVQLHPISNIEKLLFSNKYFLFFVFYF